MFYVCGAFYIRKKLQYLRLEYTRLTGTTEQSAKRLSTRESVSGPRQPSWLITSLANEQAMGYYVILGVLRIFDDWFGAGYLYELDPVTSGLAIVSLFFTVDKV